MVKKSLLKDMCLILILVVMSFIMPVSKYAAHAFSTEQIQSEMPNITAYANNSEELIVSEIEAFLDYQPIEVVNVEKFSVSNTPVEYYLLIDDSGSVPNKQIESIKASLLSFDKWLRPGDSVTIVSVGTLEILFSGTDLNDDYKNKIQSINNDKQETYLYEAIAVVNDMILNKGNENSCRNVIIALSDGLNEAVAKTTYDEIITSLEKSDTPLYAMGIKSSDNENLEDFGKLARSTGGTIYSFEPEECEAKFNELNNELMNIYKITLKADNNIVGKERTLILRSTNGSFSEEYKINPIKWIPDNIAPEILEFKKISANQFEIIFSEPVKNADILKNIQITFEDKSLSLSTASYSELNNIYKTIVTASEDILTAEYNITLSNVVDVSNEKNPVTNSLTEFFDGAIATNDVKDSVVRVESSESSTGTILLIIITVIVIAVIIATIVVIKKNGGIVTVEGKAMFANNLKVKHYIKEEKVDLLDIFIDIIAQDGSEKTLEIQVVESLTVGRSQKNDLYFDDENMSRFHFILKIEQGKLFINDNGSSSGTIIENNFGKTVLVEALDRYIGNSYAETGARELFSGDYVSAGRTKMRIRW